MRLTSQISASSQPDINRLAIWIAVAMVIAAGAIRYVQQPSFWLDEAFIAVSLRNPSFQIIFAPLEYGQFFPRIYLAAIAMVREAFGYQIWSLRLLPFLSFLIATLIWARLLAKRSRSATLLGLLAASLLIGSTFWLDQAIQLKQYTFDVLLALIPFLASDDLFKESLVDGKRRRLLILLALPCLLSYTYPMALGARAAGWYLDQGRRESWRLDAPAIFILALSVALALAGIWATDHRFNLQAGDAYITYWNDCILRSTFEQGAGDTLRLIAKFLWGWHGRQPLVTAVLVPLQILGVYSVISRWKKREAAANDPSWGSRSIGSLVLLAGVMLASALLYYPICAGRVSLFTQIHTQILTLEGALFILNFSSRRKAALIILPVFTTVVMFHSGREYIHFARSEAAENIRPMLSSIDSSAANTIWVHPCSVAQVRSLPDALPVEQVVLGTDKPLPQRGEKAWIIWTHLGNETCVRHLEQVRSRARSWQVIHEGPDRGLALAEF